METFQSITGLASNLRLFACHHLPPVRTVNSFQLRDLGVHYEIGWSHQPGLHQPNLWPRSRTALHSSPIWFGCEYVEHHALLVHAGEKDAGFKRFHTVGWFHCELMCITFRLQQMTSDLQKSVQRICFDVALFKPRSALSHPFRFATALDDACTLDCTSP